MRWSYSSAFDITIDEEGAIVVKPISQPYKYTEKTAKFLTGGYLHSTATLKSRRSLKKFDLKAVGDFIPNVAHNLLIEGLRDKQPSKAIYDALVEVSMRIEKMIAGEISIEQMYPEIKDLFSADDQKSIEKLLTEENSEEKIGDKEVEEINRNLRAGSQVLRLEGIVIDNSDINVFLSIFKNENLKSLEIINVAIDEKYCNNLIELLKTNKSLMTLSLINTKLTDKAAIILAHGLLKNSHPLIGLDFSYNHLGSMDNQGIINLLNILKDTQVQYLNLKQNNLVEVDEDLAIDILKIPYDIVKRSKPIMIFFDECDSKELQTFLEDEEGLFRFNFDLEEQEADELEENQLLQKRKSADKTQQEVKQKSPKATGHYDYGKFLVSNFNSSTGINQNSVPENKIKGNLEDDADAPTLDSIQ